MGKSLLARGLGKLKRDKAKQQKGAARQAYARFLEELEVDPQLAVLEARNGRAIDGNIYYLLRELITDPAYAKLTLCVVTENEAAEAVMRRKLALIPGAVQRLQYVRLSSEDYFRAMATAGYIVNDATIGNFFVKRPGQVYLNVWHGTPLKTMGRRVSHEPHAVGNVQKNFIAADYLLYPSDYMMEHMVEDYMIADLSPATVLMGGYPRNTVFFDEEERQRARLFLLGNPAGAPQAVVLGAAGASDGMGAPDLSAVPPEGAPGAQRIYVYMPTWRPGLMGEKLQGILEEFESALQPDEKMYVNVHPLAEETVDFDGLRRVRPFPDMIENYAVLNGADALLTDYSSVFYDYAVSGRKVVLLTYDEEEYFATRGLYEPIDSLPFPQTKTVAEALDALRTPKDYDDSAFLEKYCRYESKEAAQLLCRQVFLGEPCMEQRQIPGNSRPNVLVWGGDLAPGPRTDETMAFLAAADQSRANVFLTFNRGDLKDRFTILERLPEGIRYIGRAGKMLLDPAQEEITQRYRKGKCSFEAYWETVRPAFARERQRYYAGMRIDRIIQIPETAGERSPGPESTKEELEFSTYEIG